MMHKEIKIKKLLAESRFSHNEGFTLIETLVSITILSSVVALMVVMAGSRLNEAVSLKENLTSQYLAQEALDSIRSIRDSTYLANPNDPPETIMTKFLQTVSACNNQVCSIDPVSLTTNACTPNTCSIYVDPTTGYYYGDGTITGSVPSQFLRYITITPNANNVSATVSVTVRNKNATGTESIKKTITIDDELWAWE